MRINKLEIKGFRGYKDKVMIDFPEHVPAVFVGINGAGKTAILDAIVYCYSVIHEEFTKEKPYNLKTISDNINLTKRFKGDFESKTAGLSLYFDSSCFKEERIGILIHQESSYLPKLQKLTYNGLQARLKELKTKINEIPLPILVYYPTERTVAKPSMKNQLDRLKTKLDAWKGALDKHVDFKDLFLWFRETEDLENEIRLNDNYEYSHPALEAVRNALLSVVEGFSKVRVKRRGKPEIIIEKAGTQLSINQLSHGEKTLLAMVGDLARRLAIANPDSKNPLEGEGVVLIDEIDLHLHPKWQKDVVRKLQKTFPNVQFILTTHSPIVLSQLKSESIFLLEDNQCTPLINKGVKSYGLTIEDVLMKIQGTSHLLPVDVEAKFREMFDLLDNDKIEEAKKIKSELEGIVESTHPELLKGDTDIKFKELLS